jgi:hypothetical protein
VKVPNTFWERVLREQGSDGRKVPKLPRLKRRAGKNPSRSNAPADDVRAQVLETIRANQTLEDEQ